ncbi:hypothetical protein [Bordetella pseudohinzii]|uniref:Uncharacterized protein n=1 Tax=Bordetella pseudohinzii TaxID=1331258 RepID=A0A0J6C2U3_9BORD|nr:hypothetical protein [Bordetella pseudohinzii]ANY16132.1 hypothetical protein BBN53_09615 [Bordetella pseudohinzii]KMM25383.1 hypothetical protein L540_21170 [Bordetella pseudohinzii]KXA76562.1 hypothetical protein AW878_17795 [Bordetella pseudohinzii]KXA81271.1 hypothetical protein AW877_04920 [Bordetella pseudohinzii]CUJ03700.1 Uncharacterised protein [Bordetella pseudohinzii]
MSLIIAAHYDTFDQAGAAARQLFDQGFPVADMHTFYVNPPGEHAVYPIGGDEAIDPQARGQGAGAWLGALLLGTAAASVAALALAPPWAVIAVGGVGAYIGSLTGALGRAQRLAPHPARRHGVLLALRVDPGREAEGSRVLRAHGGQDLERAHGQWRNGRWEDFDPLSAPGR